MLWQNAYCDRFLSTIAVQNGNYLLVIATFAYCDAFLGFQQCHNNREGVYHLSSWMKCEMRKLGLSPQFEAIPTIFRPPSRALLTSTCPTNAVRLAFLSSLPPSRRFVFVVGRNYNMMRSIAMSMRSRRDFTGGLTLLTHPNITCIKCIQTLHHGGSMCIRVSLAFFVRFLAGSKKLCSQRRVGEKISGESLVKRARDSSSYCHARSTHSDGGNKRTVASFSSMNNRTAASIALCVRSGSRFPFPGSVNKF